MRLTAELVNTSLSYLNPLKERELDLRGRKIPYMENLGSAHNHDCIDLTDNDIPTLQNLPLMPRLQTLLLARNRITAIQPSIVSNIPNLYTLVLAENRIKQLADLDVLAQLRRLTHLVLKGCPVVRVEHYRYWVLWRCPNVRFLDYSKVKQVERDKANEMFGTAEAPTALASKIMRVKSRQFDVGQGLGAGEDGGDVNTTDTDKIGRVKRSEAETAKLQEMIKNAKSLSEITKLEKELNEGRMPAGMIVD